MDDKKAFKILSAISIVLCIIIVLFNAWVAPNLLPTYKEYEQIFNIDIGNGLEEDIDDEADDDNEGDEDEEDDDDNEVVMININEADKEELMQIPYIGEVLAEKIIDYRNDYGPFESEEDLLSVSGIGVKKLSKMIDYISLD